MDDALLSVMPMHLATPALTAGPTSHEGMDDVARFLEEEESEAVVDPHTHTFHGHARAGRLPELA